MHEAVYSCIDQVLDGNALSKVLAGVGTDEPDIMLEDQGLGGAAKLE